MLLTAALVPPFIVQLVALVVASAGIAYVCYRLGLVPIVGFLVAGVFIGPHALGLVSDLDLVNAAAEAGVILLLFTIGIEFSLEKLARIKRLIFVGGSLQVVLASLATMALLMFLGVGWRAGLFTGLLVSLSSTAIVLKLLGDRGEADHSYGLVAFGLLIFQDLAIIVMVLLVPMLGGSGGSANGIGIALAKAAGIILLVLLVARRLMPPLLERVARTCSPELFLLTVIAICFGTAWLTSVAGVSLSLGAFLAGLLVSESRFSHHAFGEIMPLQILFSATFFASVGMLLDLSFVVRNLPLVLAAVATVLVVKILTTGASVRALGYPVPVAAAAALSLSQVGEFSFVLERAGQAAGLSPAGVGQPGSQAFIAASVMLMVVTPQLTVLGSSLAARLERRRPAPDRLPADRPELSSEPATGLAQHAVVAGYGQAARQLVPGLVEAQIPFLITTLSPGGAIEAEAAGVPVLRGDYARQHTLRAAGIDRARIIVLADDDPAVARRVVAVARSLAPGVTILVRTRYQTEAASLREAGADLVVVEEVESVVQVLDEVMQVYRVEPEAIARYEAIVRANATADIDGTLRSVQEVPLSPLERADIDPRQTIALVPTEGTCKHVSQIHAVHPSARGCEECLKMGAVWVHLRLCMTCGHVGCCDSSRHKHATKHFHATSHPIVRSLEPGEEWGWCYADEVVL
jgi:monovalent cation:H+ antiporter-2, CPA2 family